jgi:hypothetical protein
MILLTLYFHNAQVELSANPMVSSQQSSITPLQMPVTTSRLSLVDLPAEIIQEIAYHLEPGSEDPDHSDFSDVEYDRMSVTSMDSMDSEDSTPMVKVLPCCRAGDEESTVGEERIPVLDQVSTFSVTSKRIRDLLFGRRQKRRRTIRYCDRWREETMQSPEATRSRYT